MSTTPITILTSYGAFGFDATDWGRDEDGDVHVYSDDATLATFDADAYVATFCDRPPEEVESVRTPLIVD